MEKTNPWLSVVIPIYNSEKYLRKCLNSIVSQSFEDFEVILVDDGSTDTSSDICNAFDSSDSRFQYFRIENGGALHARIFGAKQIRGQYFTFCDADDYYVNHHVFQFLFDKVSNHSEKISIVQFGYQKKYNHLKQNVRFVQQEHYMSGTEFNLNEYPKLLCSFWEQSHLSNNVWNKLYNHCLLENLPKTEERVFWGDDEILNLHLLNSIEGAYYLPDTLYVYRQSSGGTGRFSLNSMQDLDLIKKYQLEFLDKRMLEDTDSMKKILFSEIAGWFLVYLRDAANHLNDAELEKLITDTLSLPRFVLAHKFYCENSENWEAANLLRQADVQAYMKAAKTTAKKTVKSKVVQAFKTIYKQI